MYSWLPTPESSNSRLGLTIYINHFTVPRRSCKGYFTHQASLPVTRGLIIITTHASLARNSFKHQQGLLYPAQRPGQRPTTLSGLCVWPWPLNSDHPGSIGHITPGTPSLCYIYMYQALPEPTRWTHYPSHQKHCTTRLTKPAFWQLNFVGKQNARLR